MSPAVVLRSKFVTPESSAFKNYINYMDRKDAKKHVKVESEAYERDNFDVFYQFMDYMDDTDKQGALFTTNKDLLSDHEKKYIKNQFKKAQQNESPMWQDVISFDNTWLAEQGLYDPDNHTVNEGKIRIVIREMMSTMLKAEGMEQSALWTASLHYNTDNIHVHVATTEPYPTRERIQVLDRETNTWKKEYCAKRKPKTLDKMKSRVANMILDRSHERNKIDELLRGTINHKKEQNITLAGHKKTKKLFSEAISQLPEDRKQWRYGYQSVNKARPYIDEIANIYLKQFHSKEMTELETRLDDEVHVMKGMYGENSDYKQYKKTKLNDLKKRMGNAILSEMRAIDKQGKQRLFQHIPLRKNSIVSKRKSLLYDKYPNNELHISMIHLRKNLRRTFYDYQNERRIDEFDRMIDGNEI